FGELEAALEGAPGNAMVEIALLLAVFTLARERQHAIADLDVQIFLGKACDRDRDPIVGLIGTLDIVGRVAVAGIDGRIEHVEQMVESDGGTEIGGKVTHSTTS